MSVSDIDSSHFQPPRTDVPTSAVSIQTGRAVVLSHPDTARPTSSHRRALLLTLKMDSHSSQQPGEVSCSSHQSRGLWDSSVIHVRLIRLKCHTRPTGTIKLSSRRIGELSSHRIREMKRIIKGLGDSLVSHSLTLPPLTFFGHVYSV